MDESRAAKGPAALGVLALQQMALPGAGPKHFPASGNLEALCRGFFGFNAFGSSHNFFLSKRAGNIGLNTR